MQERRKVILKELEQNGYVRVSTLSQLLQCTEMTIRRDLSEIAEEGLLKRTHGGAVKIGNNFVTDNVKDLLYSNLHRKIYISKIAYNMIDDQDTIFLDDATTCLYLAGEIKKNVTKSVNVITNSILLASELMQTAHVTLKMIGGDAAANLSATVGPEALEQIRKYRADKAFIGVNGIDFQKGITGIGYPQMEIKQAMLGHAEKIYILADSSKFGYTYLSHICQLDEVTAILTDSDLRAAYKAEIQKYQYPVIWKIEE
ncbi:DeoR/GlpR family DNA-binding transcription regulator [Faecalicatena contorta]|uniref:Transcriptional regulator, DeoR family n=1 Tax=Faecalicatena contorta TaxID=39482 RepID=A0A316A4J0_9FIRM|nr:DeoR/GlpR family DNA-binding transcription regulator [Faecalicatena contorta]PWJ51860.1 DeoR family transcriptional regulator [Faecalicatena contorta]SUQ12114.1 transcriptional regulator, DeoR family [Faecalicatena contorta]